MRSLTKKRYRVGLAHLFTPANELRLDGLRTALGGFGVGRIPPHVTLMPPSNLYTQDVPDEIYRLRRIASETVSFDVEIGPADTFSPVSPVLFLSVKGEGLARLRALHAQIAQSPLYRQEKRNYVPHVTLIDGEEEQVIGQALQLLKSVVLTQELISFEMMLSPTQGYWEPASDFRFEKSRSVQRGGMVVEIFVHGAGDISIYRLAFEEGVSPSFFWAGSDRRFRIDNQANLTVSLYHQGELIAAASAVYHSGNALIRQIVVVEELRKQGVGSLALSELMFQLRLHGVERIFALTDTEAAKFVQKCGAKPDTSGRFLFCHENGITLNSWSFSNLW